MEEGFITSFGYMFNGKYLSGWKRVISWVHWDFPIYIIKSLLFIWVHDKPPIYFTNTRCKGPKAPKANVAST